MKVKKEDKIRKKGEGRELDKKFFCNPNLFAV
jgi:hypothetical protein